MLNGRWGSWAIEVKTGAITGSDLTGLAEFTRRYPAFRPLVPCDPESRVVVERTGLSAMAWTDFLLDGPTRQA